MARPSKSGAPACPVCLETLGDANGLSLGCGHIVCSVCVVKLVAHPKAASKCPMCRTVVDVNKVKPLSKVPEAAGLGYAPRSKVEAGCGSDRQVLSQANGNDLRNNFLAHLSATARRRRGGLVTDGSTGAGDGRPDSIRAIANLGLGYPSRWRSGLRTFDSSGDLANDLANEEAVQGLLDLASESLTVEPAGNAAAAAAAAEGISSTATDSAAADNDRPKHYWAFLVDNSVSMGSAHHCSSDAALGPCSRLGMALACLTSMIDKSVRPGDRYSVTAFSTTYSTVQEWTERGEAFSAPAEMVRLVSRFSNIRQAGTCMYPAALRVFQNLQDMANAEGSAAANAASAITGTASDIPELLNQPALPQQQHAPGLNGGTQEMLQELQQMPTYNMVIITDGESDDDQTARRGLRSALKNPGFQGFKALLMRMQDGRGGNHGAQQLQRLAHRHGGAPIPYVTAATIDVPHNPDGGLWGDDLVQSTRNASMSMLAFSNSAVVSTSLHQ